MRLIVVALALASAAAVKTAPREFISSSRGGRAMRATLDEDMVDPDFCDPAAISRAGYFGLEGSAVNDGSKNYFYWMFETKNNAENDPVILWLTGGPGCSSTLALLSENGPCSVNPEGTGTVPNPYGWNANATVIWLDQPAGVGFSYGEENDYNEDMVGEDVYFFLQTFFAAHPQYSTQPFFVFGESYGGHYAPGIAHAIFNKNDEASAGYIDIQLAGLGVGNGLTNPVVQYQYYPEMAMNNTYGIKTVSEATYASMVSKVPQCLQLAEACQTDSSKCHTAQILCGQWETTPYYNTGLNPYDIRIPCEVPGLCYDFSNIDAFMAAPSTRAALHVTDASAAWQSCNYDVNADFGDDWMVNYAGYVKDLLEGGIPTLIYAGDTDFICNWIGNKAWTLALDWSGAAAFNGQVDSLYSVDGAGAGVVRTANGFTFLQVFEAGHMVPSDQPAVALDMVNKFIRNAPFTN
jgi:cathepsin A (carboxypeptidase C)